MQMVPVVSSNLSAIGWDQGTLRVQFTNGGVYDYAHVPEGVFMALMSADSKGKYFAEHVKKTYQYTKVK